MKPRARGMLYITFAGLLFSCFSIGCLGRSPDVRYFTLGTQSGLDSTQQTSDLAVLIGPVRLPGYLQRRQIVRRARGGEIKVDEFDRWLGGFEANLISALASDLRRLIGSVRIVGYPSQAPFPIDYSVRIHVDEWVVSESNLLSVKLRWGIMAASEGDSPILSTYESEIELRGGSVENLVEAHDRALAELARKLADQLIATSTRRQEMRSGPGG